MRKYIAIIVLILCCFIVTSAFSSSGEDGEKEDGYGLVRLNGGKTVDLGDVTLKDLRNGITKDITFGAYSTTKDAGSSRTVNLVDGSNAKYVKNITSRVPAAIYNSSCYKSWRDVNVGSVTIGIDKDETPPELGLHTVSPIIARYDVVQASGGSSSAAVTCSYRFTLKESSFDVKSLGNVITKVSDNNKLESSRGMLSEAEVFDKFRSRPDCQFHKLAADGESRLLITVVTDNEDDEIWFTEDAAAVAQNMEFYTLSGINLGFSNKLTFSKVSSSPEKYQSTIVMKAPDGVQAKDGEREKAFSIMFRNQDGESITEEFSLFRTPVVLIHGIWGHSTDFIQHILSLESAGYYTFINEYDNWKGPSETLPTNGILFLHGFLLPALNSMKSLNIESKKIDVVAHSMGGLFTKQFTRNKYYKTEYTYGQRAVRRLITLGTPHWGSPLASFLERDSSYFLKKPTKNYQVALLRYILTKSGRGCSSALIDLKLFSDLVMQLSYKNYDLPMYAIAGNVGNRRLLFPGIASVIAYVNDNLMLSLLFDCYSHRDMFFDVASLRYNLSYIPEDSDSVVGLSSALWSGVMGNAVSTIVGCDHVSMGSNIRMAPHVLALLAADTSVFKIPNASRSSSIQEAAYSVSKTQASLKNTIATPRVSNSNTDFEHILLESDASNTLTVNSTVNFTAAPDGGVSGDLMLVDLDIGCFEMALSGGKYKYSLDVSKDFIGKEHKFLVMGYVNGEPALSNAVGVCVKPSLPPISLDLINRDYFIVKGETQRAYVTASYTDGNSYSADGSNFGTEYYSDNDDIATVDRDGIITAVNIGSTVLTVANAGLVTEAAIHVIDGTVVQPADVSSDITVKIQTKLQGRGSVSDITLPNANNREQMTIALYNVSGDSIYADMTVSTDEYGVASFEVPPNVLEGVKKVQVWAKGDRYLAALESHDVIVEDDCCAIILDKLCLGGDANNDNVVNVRDFTTLRASFPKPAGDPAYDARADFNANSVVNIQDFLILRANLSVVGCDRPVVSEPVALAAREDAESLAVSDGSSGGCCAFHGLYAVLIIAAALAIKKIAIHNTSSEGGD